MAAINVNNFIKHYGELQAVKGVSFQVKQNELFGLIGPDGAGKTTVLRSVCTLLLPDSGSIHVLDMDVTKHVADIRRMLGYMPQRFSLYPDLTVEQNLTFFADLFKVPHQEQEQRLQQLYSFSKLEPFKKRKAGALSGGMKQKLALSCALIHTPDILVLDEPTFGVDPVSRQEFWDILRSIREEGATILVSTAYMDEANQCDRVALFSHGEIVAMDKPETLKQQYQYPLYRLQSHNVIQLRDFISVQSNVHSTQLYGNALHVSFKEPPTEQLWHEWQNHENISITNWQKQEPSIEDVFLELMEEQHD